MTTPKNRLEEFDQKVGSRLIDYKAKPVQYANLWSKLLFSKAFELQFAIPFPQPAWLEFIMNRIESLATPQDLDQVPIEKPIFILGLPRSGTTLLYHLIAAHDRAAYFNNAMNSLPRSILAIEKVRKLLNLNVHGDRHLKDSIEVDFSSPSEPVMMWQNWTGQDLYDLEYHTLTKESVGEKVIAHMRRDVRKVLLACGKTRPRFVCKYPYFTTQMLFLQEAFPGAQFIHIIRDPDAVSHSMVKLYQLIEHQRLFVKHPTVKEIIPFPRVPSLKSMIKKEGPESVKTTATVWKETLELVNRDKHRVKQLLEIRYEDLVSDPSTTLKKIFDFTGLETPSASNSDYATEFSKIGKLRHQNHYPVDPSIREIVGTLAKQNGYES